MLPVCRDVRALGRALLERGWLTAFQINQVHRGEANSLMLGHYVLLDRLGKGGMGEVFRARHRHMARTVALKVIRAEKLGAEGRARFLREVEAAARLDHPHVVHAYDADEDGGRYYLAMEYVEGTDLGRLVKKRGLLAVAVACEYVRQAALGLQHAHERGLVHRDIKPSNLLLDVRRGVVKVSDFGLSRLAVWEDKEAGLTREGAVLGTADYVAPEQVADARAVDVRADLYSLGGTLYYLLSGRSPLPEGSALQKILHHVLWEPQPIEERRAGVPPALAAVVRRLLVKRPEDRYQTPADLVAALAEVREGEPTARPISGRETGEIDLTALEDTLRAAHGNDASTAASSSSGSIGLRK
jgi:serine/threonine-protein kinase